MNRRLRRPGGHRKRLIAAALTLATAGSAAAADTDPTRLEVRAADNRFTIHAHRASVLEIIEQLGRYVPLVVTSHDPLSEPVTRTVADQPLDRALRLVLKHRNFVLQHAPAGMRDHDGLTTRIWIYPRSGAPSSASPAPRGRPAAILGGAADRFDRAAVGDPSPRPPDLPAGLNDADHRVRADAVSALAMDAGDHVIVELAAALSDPHATVRENAVVVLDAVDSELSDPLLRQALNDENEVVREAALGSLIGRGVDQALRTLAVALRDPAPALRIAAVEALGDLGGDEALFLLQQAQSDPDPVIRRTAGEAIQANFADRVTPPPN